MRKIALTISLVLLLAAGVQISYVVDSFPGFHGNGECALCHNEPATAYNSSYMNSEIVLDGLPNEEFFDGDLVVGRETRVPVGTMFGGVHTFVKIIFAQNATHLFVYAEWEDIEVEGADSTRYVDADGISIIWNINATDLPDAYFSGMKTENAGEHADAWVWKPDAEATSVGTNGSDPAGLTHITGNIVDTSFDDSGWVDEDKTADVMTNATWGYKGSHAQNSYSVEFVRPLITDDPNDQQFDKIGYYEFEIAIYNGSAGSSHAVSFEHSVWVYGVCITDCDIPIVITETLPAVTETLPAVTNNVNVTVTETSTEESSPVSLFVVLLAIGSMGMLVNLRRRK